MDNNYIYERDFYCIDDFYGEEKWFEYFGYTYVEEKYKVVDCHIEEKLSIVLNHKGGVRGWIDEKMSETKQYIDVFENKKQTKNYIDHFFYGELAGEERPLDSVDINTPCGNYWSRF